MNIFPVTCCLIFLSHLAYGIPARGSNAPDSCDEGQLRRCADNAEPLLRNSDLAVPDTPKAVSQVCSIWSDLTNCINNYTMRCMTPSQRLEFNTAMKDPLSSMKNLCGNSEQQSEYLNHAPCVKKISTQEKYCGFQYKVLIDNVAESTSIKQVCCARAKFMNCLLAKTPSGCGSKTSQKASSQNATRLAVAILDNSLAYMSQQCTASRFEESDCPGIDGNRVNSKGPLNNSGLATSASDENVGSQFQLHQGQRPAGGGTNKIPNSNNGKPATGTKEIKENNTKPITSHLASKEQTPTPQTKENVANTVKHECFLLTFSLFLLMHLHDKMT